jgi:S-adenosylmethionine:tRNA ribosyltransferase-isomerase
MKLSDFDYEYPKELVAQHPLAKRDASRMMILDRKTGSMRDEMVCNLPSELKEGDLLVLNDSRVAPARIFGRGIKGMPIELLVVEPEPGMRNVWRCLIKRAKRLRRGDTFFFGMQARATVRGRSELYLLVEFRDNTLELAIKHHGVPPLPPYINRDGFEAYSNEDRERYQTIYADKAGSAAAPTAGLHLSQELLEKIEGQGVGVSRVTLHVGIDTFAPMRIDDTSDHRMHGERIEIPGETATAIARTKNKGGRVIAVGTTTTRVLESACVDGAPGNHHEWDGGSISAGSWTTNLFIEPGFKFKAVDALLTNFHQPKSTLILMVSAFATRDLIFKSYQKAIDEKYRLFSYGDCMLIT